MNELSLFSGYGGFSLGLRLAGMETRTVGYVEIDKYCQRIIQARIKDGFLDDGPIFPDISTFNGNQCRGVVDIITAGFPCQPHSVAGQRRGEADDRNLWPDTLRVIREVGPRFVLLENVPGILANGYAGTVVGQLSEAGYDCLWGCVPAAAVGAPHRRERWWCLAIANTDRKRCLSFCGDGSGTTSEGPTSRTEAYGQDGPVADSQQQRGQRGEIHRGNQSTALAGRTTDSPKSGSADVADTNCESSAVNGDNRTDAGSCGPRGVVCRRGGGNDRRESDTRQDDGLVPNGDVADADKFDGDDGRLGTGQVCRKRPETPGIPPSVLENAIQCGDGAKIISDEDGRSNPTRPTSWISGPGWWAVEPDVGRVADGVASRVDRLRALGNGIVPAVVAEFLSFWRSART